MNQLINPDLSIVGEIGMCLHYAGLVFGISSGPDTAWKAWQQTQFKHTDQNFPSGVSFPVWFSGAGGAGHVAVYTPNGIYSSPYSLASGHNVLSSIAQVEKLYGVKYVGWSEDIEGKRVIEGGDMSTVGDFEARIIAKDVYGYTNELDIEGAVKGLLGMETNTALRQADASATHAAFEKYISDLQKAASSGDSDAQKKLAQIKQIVG